MQFGELNINKKFWNSKADVFTLCGVLWARCNDVCETVLCFPNY